MVSKTLSHVINRPASLSLLRSWEIVVVPCHVVQVWSHLASSHLLPKRMQLQTCQRHIRGSFRAALARPPAPQKARPRRRAPQRLASKCPRPTGTRGRARRRATKRGLKYRATRSSGGGKSSRAYGEPRTRQAELRNSLCTLRRSLVAQSRSEGPTPAPPQTGSDPRRPQTVADCRTSFSRLYAADSQKPKQTS